MTWMMDPYTYFAYATKKKSKSKKKSTKKSTTSSSTPAQPKTLSGSNPVTGKSDKTHVGAGPSTATSTGKAIKTSAPRNSGSNSSNKFAKGQPHTLNTQTVSSAKPMMSHPSTMKFAKGQPHLLQGSTMMDVNKFTDRRNPPKTLQGTNAKGTSVPSTMNVRGGMIMMGPHPLSHIVPGLGMALSKSMTMPKANTQTLPIHQTHQTDPNSPFSPQTYAKSILSAHCSNGTQSACDAFNKLNAPPPMKTTVPTKSTNTIPTVPVTHPSTVTLTPSESMQLQAQGGKGGPTALSPFDVPHNAPVTNSTNVPTSAQHIPIAPISHPAAPSIPRCTSGECLGLTLPESIRQSGLLGGSFNPGNFANGKIPDSVLKANGFPAGTDPNTGLAPMMSTSPTTASVPNTIPKAGGSNTPFTSLPTGWMGVQPIKQPSVSSMVPSFQQLSDAQGATNALTVPVPGLDSHNTRQPVSHAPSQLLPSQRKPTPAALFSPPSDFFSPPGGSGAGGPPTGTPPTYDPRIRGDVTPLPVGQMPQRPPGMTVREFNQLNAQLEQDLKAKGMKEKFGVDSSMLMANQNITNPFKKNANIPTPAPGSGGMIITKSGTMTPAQRKAQAYPHVLDGFIRWYKSNPSAMKTTLPGNSIFTDQEIAAIQQKARDTVGQPTLGPGLNDTQTQNATRPKSQMPGPTSPPIPGQGPAFDMLGNYKPGTSFADQKQMGFPFNQKDLMQSPPLVNTTITKTGTFRGKPLTDSQPTANPNQIRNVGGPGTHPSGKPLQKQIVKKMMAMPPPAITDPFRPMGPPARPGTSVNDLLQSGAIGGMSQEQLRNSIQNKIGKGIPLTDQERQLLSNMTADVQPIDNTSKFISKADPKLQARMKMLQQQGKAPKDSTIRVGRGTGVTQSSQGKSFIEMLGNDIASGAGMIFGGIANLFGGKPTFRPMEAPIELVP